MSFSVLPDKQRTAEQIIDAYFDALQRGGPGGMRSQCYATGEDDGHFVHIKSFRKESVANRHFRSAPFLEYTTRLSAICGSRPFFRKLLQQQTFESIY